MEECAKLSIYVQDRRVLLPPPAYLSIRSMAIRNPPCN